MSSSPLLVLAVLGLNVAVSEWLVRRTPARHFGTALLVIVVTAITANLGWIPTGVEPVPLYDGIFGAVAPMSLFLLLLGVRLADLRTAGVPMLALFAIGAIGTAAGVLAGMAVVDGEAAFGEDHAALAGMFVGTYTGGSVNFNAVALEYGMHEKGAIYTGAIAVDSIMTSVWMVLTIAIPRGFALLRRRAGGGPAPRDALTGVDEDTESVHPADLALLVALAAASLWASDRLAGVLAARGVALPSILILTTIALLLAQLPAVARLRGARGLGLLGVYVFLAVIGAYCDLGALAESGAYGLALLGFVTVAITVHGVLTFGGAALLRLDRDMAAVASQANIGGGTSALALARSLGRGDLVLPGILLGSLGNAVGTYLGFLTAAALGG